MAVIEDDEVIQIFIDESKEHLDGIEVDLLDIEQAGDNLDMDLVNKVFRAIHSIKGGAGFLGLDNIKNLSHEMENLLNLIRNSEIIPTPAVISALLSSLDMLKDLVNNHANSNDEDISEKLVELKGAISASLPEEKKESAEKTKDIFLPDGRLIFTLPELELQQAQKAGRILYLAEYDILRDIERKNITPMEVIKEIQLAGMLLESKVDVDAIGKIDEIGDTCPIPFFILFATVLEPDIIPGLVKIDPAKIYRYNDAQEMESIKEQPSVKEEVKPKKKKKKVEPKEEITETSPPELPAHEVKKEEAKPEPPAPPPVKKSIQSVESKKDTKPKPAKAPKSAAASSTLRVNIKILDILMNLAGEMVLTRNQLVQTFTINDKTALGNAIQRADLVTSELQEAIMSTRMQPIGVVFSKFHRVVRDMSESLGKEINLTIEGEDVDLDKTIIEAIGDPLTHLVRNSVDHGIETPDARRQAGKKLPATIQLKAYHEAGHVIIEVVDDGAGIDPQKVKKKALKTGIIEKDKLDEMSSNELVKLIFRPGFSLAKEVTDVSGRGVGMDVVHSNLIKLGGIIDINSKVGAGTSIRIKLPLTLAIIPSLIIAAGNERFAIPQVNLVELVRIPAAQVKKRIECIDDAAVIRLRGELLPLIHLSDTLKISRTFNKPPDGEVSPDKRLNIPDRRYEVEDGLNVKDTSINKKESRKVEQDRRIDPNSAVNIVVVSAGDLNYGIIVNELLDSEEIVVKPLGSHLRSIKTYAGATILGDGRVALILDVSGVRETMGLKTVKDEVKEKIIDKKLKDRQDAQSLLIVKNAADEQFAFPLGLVSRLERIHKNDIESSGGKTSIKYRGSNLILLSIEQAANVGMRDDVEHPYVIIFPFSGKEVGIVVSQIVDVVDISEAVDEKTFRQPGILGSSIILKETTMLVDPYGIVSIIMPEWVVQQEAVEKTEGEKAAILVVEDSKFFLNQIKAFTEEAGYNVVTALDGLEALQELENMENDINLILTDIEMPNLDGVDMTAQIRSNPRFENIPVIALTSVAGDAAEQRAIDAGIDEYLIKLDREKVLERVNYYLTHGRQ